jgi:hypothetical protein
MNGRNTKAALLVAGLVAAAVASAPVAGALSNWQETEIKSRCQTNGSVSIKSKPGTMAPPANQPVFPWLGMPGAR